VKLNDSCNCTIMIIRSSILKPCYIKIKLLSMTNDRSACTEVQYAGGSYG
jgi:hypothetical protein